MKNDAPATLKLIMQWGKAQHLLDELMRNEIFDCHFISKHNPYFHSDNEELADKLDDLRRKIIFIYDQLSDIREAIEIEEEE